MSKRKYRKKPIVIEAIQYTGTNYGELADFADGIFIDRGNNVVIETKKGQMRAKQFDYIIKGIEGEVYPCARETFLKTYEEIDE